jgi:DNA-binding beta-propeller fold protein YncE
MLAVVYASPPRRRRIQQSSRWLSAKTTTHPAPIPQEVAGNSPYLAIPATPVPKDPAREALDVYQQGRRLLAQELGLEPGEGLKRLEHAVLAQDPALGAPARTELRKAPAPKRPRRRLLSGALAIVILAGLAGLAVALTGGSARALPVRANSIAVIDMQTNSVVKDVPIDGRPVAIAANAEGVYVADQRESCGASIPSAVGSSAGSA